MNKNVLVITFCFCLSILFFNEVFTNKNGAPASNAGSPLGNTCGKSTCHNVATNLGPGTASITSNVPLGGYDPGMTYTITATINETGKVRYGFQVLAGLSSLMTQVGTAKITDLAGTQIKLDASSNQYVAQRTAGSSGTDMKSWTFDWTAPNVGTGDVTFYGAFNAANNNGNKSGDAIYTTTLQLSEMLVANEPDLDDQNIQVFPTVFSDVLNIKINREISEGMFFKIFDLNGKEVFFTDLGNFQGQFNKSIQLYQLNSGIYFAQFYGSGILHTQKLIKQ